MKKNTIIFYILPIVVFIIIGVSQYYKNIEGYVSAHSNRNSPNYSVSNGDSSVTNIIWGIIFMLFLALAIFSGSIIIV